MDVTYLLQKMEALRQHHSGNDDSGHCPYPSSSNEARRDSSSPSLPWALLQTLQKGQEVGALNSSEILAAGMTDVWRASTSLSKLVTTASSSIKTAVFKTADKYGSVRPFTSFDGAYEDWAELCASGQAYDLSASINAAPSAGDRKIVRGVEDEIKRDDDDGGHDPIDFGSSTDEDDKTVH
jgi:hypothetical protein